MFKSGDFEILRMLLVQIPVDNSPVFYIGSISDDML